MNESTSDDAYGPTATDARPHLDLVRLSNLVADGEHPFPSTLSSTDAMDLASRVRCLRRQRLMRVLAKLVAKDLLSDGQKRFE